ncbi:RNA polymerase sigma factor [Actomonas aquatica]|uniref:RNA polymerase sigma factor n=1 Tax=Actomonas aquatica TaxID=2866162 RepID=A0ABZ1CAP6_9BACT|nr:RNA polymerase sigma factor [Opitutus sp. WL0086]WRQ88769.1 RNA polymerase sigma factor [Opitutus sp. WL0086]
MKDPDDASTRPAQDFSSLYQTTIAPLRRYLGRLLGNHSEAEEIAHDAFARIYQLPANKPEALLYTTARRLAINRIKRRSISPIAPTDAPLENAASSMPDVTRQVIARQELELLDEAINDLPPGCRNVLLLRKVELLSHKEIGERLGIAVSTVEKQHARALRLLRASLLAKAEDASSPFATDSPRPS